MSLQAQTITAASTLQVGIVAPVVSGVTLQVPASELTFNDGTQVSAAMPFPVQDATGNASLASIATSTAAGATAANQATANTLLGDINTGIAAVGTNTGEIATYTSSMATALAGTLAVKEAPIGAVTYVDQNAILTGSLVATTSGTIVAPGALAGLRSVVISTLPGSQGNIYFRVGTTAAVGVWGFAAANGGSYTFSPVPSAAIEAISDSGTGTIMANGNF